jgi:hypothetical protein
VPDRELDALAVADDEALNVDVAVLDSELEEDVVPDPVVESVADGERVVVWDAEGEPVALAGRRRRLRARGRRRCGLSGRS